MKLLGIRICEHDSNFSYFDGEKVHYLKTERKYQIKHHGVNHLQEWEQIIFEQWNINSKVLDEIAIVFDPWLYDLSTREDWFYPSIEIDFPANCKVTRLNHHYAHHLSCFPLCDSINLNGVVMDGFGDYDRCWSVFRNNKLISEGSVKQNGSIGLEMSEIGKHFDLQGHYLDIAGKIMSLQSYGNIDQELINFLKKFKIEETGHIFNIYYGLDKSKQDWLRTIHEYTADILIEFMKRFFSKNEVFCFSGGVALNVCWNTKIKKYFKNIIIPPHCGDEGLSLGALEYLRIKHNLPKLKLDNFPYCQSDEQPSIPPNISLIKKTSELLKQQKIIGWYQGNGEIGPRALGNRSILADPRDREMKNKVNKIKKREDFRPFGSSTINKSYNRSDYMLFAYPINSKKYPAIAHVDNTCRHQTLYNSSLFKDLIEQFYVDTECDTLLNTSLNINGKPIASHKSNALDILNNSELDGLVFGNELYLK